MKKYKDFINEIKKPTGELKDACWKGYTAVGMKNKNGRKVPNCVPEETQIQCRASASSRAQPQHFGRSVIAPILPDTILSQFRRSPTELSGCFATRAELVHELKACPEGKVRASVTSSIHCSCGVSSGVEADKFCRS